MTELVTKHPFFGKFTLETLERVAFRPKFAKLSAHVERFGLNEGWDSSLCTHTAAHFSKRLTLMNLLRFSCPQSVRGGAPCRTSTSSVLQMPLIWKNAVKSTTEPICPSDAKPTGSKCELADTLTLSTLRKVVLGKQEAFSTLPGYAALFDQCEYGATTINNDGFSEPIKKSTRIQTAKNATFNLMSR